MRKSICSIMIIAMSAIFSGCGNRLPSGTELRNVYASHKQVFNRAITMLKEDGAFSESSGNPAAALMLNPFDSQNSRDLKFSDARRQAYKTIFDEIGLRYSALVFGRRESVIFVVATKGLAIGGGGTTRGIAYIAHPDQNLGFRVVQTEKEAENSTYGGVNLVPLEGNWYLYYVNPS